MNRLKLCIGALLTLCVPSLAWGQSAHPIPQVTVKHALDSGALRNLGAARGTIFSAVVTGPEAPWIRLQFAKAELGRTPVGGTPTMLKMTSLLDGKFQTMHAIHLKQWQNSSAYFNGNSVLVELIADPGAGPSHLTIDQIIVGTVEEGGIASICGPADDRVLSKDPKAARIMPIGCTGWLIDDANHCFLSAGHCTVTGGTIQFNVPLSTAGGAVQNPGPEDQYAVDPATSQSVNGGIGNDWWYFGCFPNPNTGLTPYEAQQDFYVLADAAPPVNGQTIRITGYGVDSSPPQNNQVQQTHSGPYFSMNGTTVQYQVDTTGGNSGSGVLNETDGVAIGIHTHAGCNGGGGANQGTAIHNAGLQNALANPDGSCIAMPSLEFVFPDGLPLTVNPGGDSIRVHVEGVNGGSPAPGTGKFYFNSGKGFVELSMTEVKPNVYDAILPSSACGGNVEFYFSAENARGDVVLEPPLGASAAYGALSAVDVIELLYDPIESVPQSWAKSADASLTGGAWMYGNPNGTTNNGVAAAPENDATPGTGVAAWISGNGPAGGAADAHDVDGGPAHLLSPVLAVQGVNAIVSYAQWFYSSSTSDALTVSITNNNGATWVPVATITSTGSAWQTTSFTVSDFIEPTNEVRLRFSVSDASPDHVVEAGIDEFRVLNLVCGACVADITGDQVTDVDDLLAVINNWGPCAGCAADVAPAGGNDVIDVDDLLTVINGWGPCP